MLPNERKTHNGDSGKGRLEVTDKEKFISSLVSVYRQGRENRVVDLLYFCQQTGADYEEIERYAADLKAEGSIKEEPLPHAYRLTDSGYAEYSKKSDAIEQLQGA
jgi:hypothetical protein